MEKMFTTPSDVPEGLACRTLKIPNNGIWLGIFNQVLLETLDPYNWEQTYPEDMTIEDTIAVCDEIIKLYWVAEDCTDGGACLQPDGYRVLRLNLNGFIEQLTNGAWTAPTGDYEVPPTPAREEPTPAERKCLAAANAANVLEQTYEQVTDAIAEGLTVAELAVIMATELTLLLGPAFGFIVPAFIFLLEAAALAFIEIAEFMGTDVWDEEFTDLLMCALLDCATDEADVVTFDYQCVIDNLANGVDLLNPLAQSQLLLFGQVNFMLSIIGVDGLNLAGATTAIDFEDCAECNPIVELENLFGTAVHLGDNLWRITSGLQVIGGVNTQAARVRRVDLDCNWQILSITPVGSGFNRNNFWYDCSSVFHTSPPIGNCLLEWNPDNYNTAGGAAKVVDIQVAPC